MKTLERISRVFLTRKITRTSKRKGAKPEISHLTLEKKVARIRLQVRIDNIFDYIIHSTPNITQYLLVGRVLVADFGHRFSMGSKKPNGKRAVKCKTAEKGCPVRGMLSSDEALVVLNVSAKISKKSLLKL